uniref:Hemimethylated DNA-binding domain-containing protein n=1 Tax=Ciona savignyi TaxID=51511 RepID=H2Y5G1_CIOSA
MEPENESTRLHRLMLLFRQSKNFRTAMEDNRAIQTSLREQANVPSVSVMEARILVNNNAKLKKRNEPLKIKLRSADENHKVMYSVGLVMQHKRYEYLCVIRGWDNFCDMSEQWKVQMGIHRLTDGADQPYYNVLVHSDGSERYAAQESLGFYEESFEEIDHPEIGKYFHSISKPGDGVRHYIPNPTTQSTISRRLCQNTRKSST